MPQAAEVWTAEQVRALPDDGLRHEVVDGEHLVTPAPRAPHQIALSELEALLRPYVKEHGLGKIIRSPADLEFDPHTLMQPDLFVTIGRRVKTWQDALPLRLAVEVLSPSTARADRIVKRRRLQRAKVPEYWIVDLDARLIEGLAAGRPAAGSVGGAAGVAAGVLARAAGAGPAGLLPRGARGGLKVSRPAS
ncbi:MAG: Uma2 family endonuclease [Bryobacteraceae bacterium]